MSHIRWAALCAVTTFLCVPSSVQAEPVSLWNLNGSVISLEVDGPSLAFRYKTVRTGLRDEGVKTGTLLFSGTRDGNAITGTGYVFSRRCGALPYPVSGVAVDAGTFRLYGSSPIALDANCRPLKYLHDVNEFRQIRVIAAAPAKIIPAASTDRPAPAELTQLRQDSEHEERRLAELRAYTTDREACQAHEVAACDAALASPLVTPDDTTLLRAWREAALALAAAIRDCQGGSYTACETALASPGLDPDQRTRVMAWKQEADPFAKAMAYIEQQFAALKAGIATVSVDIGYRPPSFDAVAARLGALVPLLSLLLASLALSAVLLRHRHVLARAVVQAGQQIVARMPDWRAALSQCSGPVKKAWGWLIDPLLAPTPAGSPADPAPKRTVKHRDTPGALAAMELAMAYLAEVRAAERPAFDDKITRKAHLNTLSLAVKQLECAAKLDPDAVLESTTDDGEPLRVTLAQIKADALFLEGLTHHTYDVRRAIPALVKSTEIDPNEPTAFYALGIVHAANHNKKKAVAALARAVALDPSNLDYRKELNRVESMTAAEIAAYKATRGAEHVFDAGIGVANAGIGVYNAGVTLWNIFAFTYNLLTWPLRLVLRIAG